jgi:hypothetical protein
MDLYQQLPVCIVLMCQTQEWGQLRDKLPQAAVDRVTLLPPLERPTEAQALRLVATRLESLWQEAGLTPPFPTYPFAPKLIEGFVREVRPTLRGVLQHCRQTLAELRREGGLSSQAGPAAPAPEDVATLLSRAFEASAASVATRRDVATSAQRQERVRSSVRRLLAAAAAQRRPLGGVLVKHVEDPPRPKFGAAPPMVVERADGRRLALEVYNDKYAHIPLKRLHAEVMARRADRALLLREAELPVSDGKATRELIGELGGPGCLVWLDPGKVRHLVGADLLLDAVSAAEVSAGARVLTRDEALRHLLAIPEVEWALATLLVEPAGAR